MSINENGKKEQDCIFFHHCVYSYFVLFKKYITYVKPTILKAEQKNDIAHKWLNTSLQLQNKWMAFFFNAYL